MTPEELAANLLCLCTNKAADALRQRDERIAELEAQLAQVKAEATEAKVRRLAAWQHDANEYLCILLDHISGENPIPPEEWFIVERAQEFIEVALKGEQK